MHPFPLLTHRKDALSHRFSFEKMQAKLMAGRWRRTTVGSSTTRILKLEQRRPVVAKAGNGAGEHGTKLAVTEGVNDEELEKKIDDEKRKKEENRKETERTVESLLYDSQESDSPTK